jgi:serine/threonine protein phosphatase PrpC
MVICSDGVFEFLSNEDVVGIVQVVKLVVKLVAKLVEVFLS